MGEKEMTVKRLESGYWHVRLGLNRFAQWPCGRLPDAHDFFGDWSEVEIRAAIRAVESAHV